MPSEWQIALAVLVGFLSGTLCTYLACRITPEAGGERREAKDETVGADAQGQSDGAPQGRPQQTTPRRRSEEQHDQEAPGHGPERAHLLVRSFPVRLG